MNGKNLRNAAIRGAAILKISANCMESVFHVKAAGASSGERDSLLAFIATQRETAAQLEACAVELTGRKKAK